METSEATFLSVIKNTFSWSVEWESKQLDYFLFFTGFWYVDKSQFLLFHKLSVLSLGGQTEGRPARHFVKGSAHFTKVALCAANITITGTEKEFPCKS